MILKENRKFVFTLFSRGAGAGLGYLLNIYIGNRFGGSSLGLYYLFITWKNMLGNFGGIGYPTKLLKSVPILVSGGKHKSLTNYFLRLTLTITAIFIMISLVDLLLTDQISSFFFNGDIRKEHTLLIVLSGFLYTLTRVLSSSLSGMNKSAIALLLEFAFVPACLFILLIFINQELLIIDLIVLYLISMTIGVIIGFILLALRYRAYKSNLDNSVKKIPIVEKDQLNMFYSAVFNIIGNSGIIIALPFFISNVEIGAFGSVHRTVLLAIIPLNAVHAYFGPRFSKAYHDNEVQRLRRMFKESQIWSVGIFLPILLLLVIFRTEIVSLFSESYSAFGYLMIFMGLAQLINVLVGPAGSLLNMANQDSLNLKVTMYTTIIGFVLNILLGYAYGLFGFGIGYLADKLIKNSTRLFFAQRKVLLA